MNKPLEETDLVAVTIDQVDYYGYIEQINWDSRDLSVSVQFHPKHKAIWFDMHEARKVNFPTDRT